MQENRKNDYLFNNNHVINEQGFRRWTCGRIIGL